jgi:hypothetical protein
MATTASSCNNGSRPEVARSREAHLFHRCSWPWWASETEPLQSVSYLRRGERRACPPLHQILLSRHLARDYVKAWSSTIAVNICRNSSGIQS